MTGAQVITGFGFKPKAVMIFATATNVAGKASWGFSDKILNIVMYDFANNGVAGSYRMLAPYVLSIQDSTRNITHAAVTSFDTDGLTLNWTKTGTGATGNADIAILALSHY